MAENEAKANGRREEKEKNKEGETQYHLIRNDVKLLRTRRIIEFRNDFKRLRRKPIKPFYYIRKIQEDSRLLSYADQPACKDLKLQTS